MCLNPSSSRICFWQNNYTSSSTMCFNPPIEWRVQHWNIFNKYENSILPKEIQVENQNLQLHNFKNYYYSHLISYMQQLNNHIDRMESVSRPWKRSENRLLAILTLFNKIILKLVTPSLQLSSIWHLLFTKMHWILLTSYFTSII